jgi:hypothetical protein|tara:strand:- start:714 stop:1010 length:297 start_codon:yes stop_codon:yes gene_type:complete
MMEAWRLAYIGRKIEARPAGGPATLSSTITITQYGNSEEEAWRRYENAVNSELAVGGAVLEQRGGRYRVRWQEKLNPDGNCKSWFQKNKERKAKANEQ